MLVHKELRYTLAHKLVDTLGKLLGLHGVGILNVLEHLGREAWQALEMQDFALGKCVTYLEVSGIGQANDVTGISLLNGTLALCHELGGRGESQCLALAYMQIRLITQESS